MENLKVWFSLVTLIILILSFSLTILIYRSFEFHLLTKFDTILEDGNEFSVSPRQDSRTCMFPQGRFHSWEDNLVTKLKPQIKVDCQKLFDGNMSEMEGLKSTRMQWKNSLNDSDLLEATANCSFVKEYFNNNLYITRLESSFPIAFVFVIHNSSQQVVRLLRLLYRPHNQYCIHPDLKSGPNFSNIFRNIASCLNNVHIASEVRDVQWGHRSIMESLMGCYKDLMEIREKQHDQQKWKYVINLCGKELPLKTNHEVVSHLLALNRTSLVESVLVKSYDYESNTRLWKERPIPHSIPYAKASAYMALTPYFINFLFTNSTAIDLYEYFKNCSIPEEHYFATVYMMPNVPSGFNPNIPKNSLFYVDRYLWDYRHRNQKKTICHGNVVHHICIVDIGDLNWIVKNPEFEHALFQNKYLMEDDHLVMDCMEEKIVAQNKLEYELDCSTSTKVTEIQQKFSTN